MHQLRLSEESHLCYRVNGYAQLIDELIFFNLDQSRRGLKLCIKIRIGLATTIPHLD